LLHHTVTQTITRTHLDILVCERNQSRALNAQAALSVLDSARDAIKVALRKEPNFDIIVCGGWKEGRGGVGGGWTSKSS